MLEASSGKQFFILHRLSKQIRRSSWHCLLVDGGFGEKDGFEQLVQDGSQNVGRQAPDLAVRRWKDGRLVGRESKASVGQRVHCFRVQQFPQGDAKDQIDFGSIARPQFRYGHGNIVVVRGIIVVRHPDSQNGCDGGTANGWQRRPVTENAEPALKVGDSLLMFLRVILILTIISSVQFFHGLPDRRVGQSFVRVPFKVAAGKGNFRRVLRQVRRAARKEHRGLPLHRQQQHEDGGGGGAVVLTIAAAAATLMCSNSLSNLFVHERLLLGIQVE